MTLAEADAAIIADLNALKLAEEPATKPTWPELQAAAEWMLIEMNQMQLHVVLTPSLLPETARNGGMIRSVVEQNPAWYQRLCAQYPPPAPPSATRQARRTRHRHQASAHAERPAAHRQRPQQHRLHRPPHALCARVRPRPARLA